MKNTSIAALVSFAAALSLAACGPTAPLGEVRGISEGMRFSITADSLPPRAMDRVTWRITVRDAATGKPIEGGEGRIWGRNKDMHPTGDGFEEAKELGTYLGRTPFITAGPWQMSVQFRRNPNSPFGQVNWMQEVRSPRPLGSGGTQ